MTLLVVPKTREDGTIIFNNPWEAIEWILPQEIVTQTIDFRWNEDFNKKQIIASNLADVKVLWNRQNKCKREQILFQLLDKLIVEPFDLSILATHYSGLLPREIYPYYWELIPHCMLWLNPDIPALIFTDENSDIPAQQKGKKEENITDNYNLEFILENKVLFPPKDYSIFVSQWLNKLKKLTESYNLTEINQKIQELEYRQILPGFRLAIVGEFSRGKSHLINSILGKEILPIVSLLTTATLSSIFPSSDNQIEVSLPNKPREIRPLNFESWHDLLATDIIIPERRTLLQTDIKTLEERYQKAQEPLPKLEIQRQQIIKRIDNFLEDMHLGIRGESQTFYVELADQKINNWIKTYQFKEKIEFFKLEWLPDQLKRVVTEITEYLSSQIEQEFTTWQKEKLERYIKEKLEKFMLEIDLTTTDFLKNVDNLRLKIAPGSFDTSSVTESEKKVSALERIFAAAGGFLITGSLGSAAMGAVFGYKEMLNSIVPQIALAVGAILLGFTSPWVLIPLLMGGGMVQGIWKMASTNEKVKELIAQEYIKQQSKNNLMKLPRLLLNNYKTLKIKLIRVKKFKIFEIKLILFLMKNKKDKLASI